jgi:aryl-alcohol dehydrogenase-like predicted oxidoreductase
MVQGGAFSTDQAAASLEVSLRELRTDRVDLLLLHEAGPSDCSDQLLVFLDRQQHAGRIRACGVGSNFARTQEVIRDRPEFARVVQFESSIINQNRESLAAPPLTAVITHGAISASFSRLRSFLIERPEVCRQWSNDLGVALASSESLASLMLAYAVYANRGGIVLFSSTRTESIRQNASAISSCRFPADLLARFAALVRGSVLVAESQ